MGQYQLKLAREAGAQIMAATQVKGLDREKNELVLKDEERIVYEKLIAADGSISIIRRQLGFNTNQIVQCIEYPVPGNFEKLEIHFDLKKFDLKKYGLTYIWIFPHKGYASVGTGTFPSMVPSPARCLNGLTDGLWIKELIWQKQRGGPSNLLWLSWL